MSLKFLYTQSYFPMNPPKEWQDLSIKASRSVEDSSDRINATFADDLLTQVLNINTLTFTGEIAKFITKEGGYITNYGVHNGLHFRIIFTEPTTGVNTTIFDGYIDISSRIEYSKEPMIFTCNIVDLNDNFNTLNPLLVKSQGFIESKGFLNDSDYVNALTIQISKKNIKDIASMIVQYINQVVMTFSNLIRGYTGAIAHVLALPGAPLTVVIGIVEILLFLTSALTEIRALLDGFESIYKLANPRPRYYKVLSYKKMLTAAFNSIGLTPDFGTLDEFLSKCYTFPAQYDFDGYESVSLTGSGRLSSGQYGYLMSEFIPMVQTLTNAKVDVRGNIVHFKNKYDPFWNTPPDYSTPNISTERSTLNPSVQKSYEDIVGTFYFEYTSDDSDAHTLSNRENRFFELHRELITELDERTNTISGLKEIKYPHPICVRKEPFDILETLLENLTIESNKFVSAFKDIVEDYTEDLESSPYDIPIADFIEEVLSISLFSDLFGNKAGAVKIDDNSFNLPKLLWLEPKKNFYNIPKDYAEHIGAKAIYEQFYKPGSPADVNDFKGQRQILNDWKVPFNGVNYNHVVNNTITSFEGFKSEITDVDFSFKRRSAVISLTQNKPFDTNIKEVEIELPDE